jgi:hypothetical protein
MPYIRSGVSRLYCLSPGAQESLGVTSFRVEYVMSCPWFRSIERLPSFFPRRMTLPFIVQGVLYYRRAKGVKIEREDSRPAGRGRQLRQSVSDPGLRDCIYNIVHTGIGDRTCPVPYLCSILLACEVGLADTEASYSSCTRVRFVG